MYDVPGRERKARTMVAVMQDYWGIPLSNLSLLNVGGSTGIIDNFLSDHFGTVTGVDIDAPAIAHAQKTYVKSNLEFHVGDALNLDFASGAFDVVICSNIYEHVFDAKQMFNEIFRVLKPGGVCYFAAANRFRWNEPHYNLPILSVLPRPLAHLYIKLAGRADYYHEHHFSYWGLKNLVRRFIVHDYTLKIASDPEKYFADYMIKPGTIKSALAVFIIKNIVWLSPGYIWVLQKSENETQSAR